MMSAQKEGQRTKKLQRLSSTFLRAHMVFRTHPSYLNTGPEIKFHLKNSEQQQRKTTLNVQLTAVILKLLQKRPCTFHLT